MPYLAYSQINIEQAKIEGTELILQLNKHPRCTSELSDSKKKISIFFEEEVTGGNQLDSISETGRFNSVEVQDNILTIYLNEKYGFTTAFFPYSRNLKISTLDWASLSTGDDHYHTGLLGIDILVAAKESFVYAVDAENKDAALMLGIILMKEGKVNSAEQYLLYSLQATTPTDDVFAALAQLYSIKGNRDYEKKFKKKFLDLGYKELKYIPVAPKIEHGNFVPDSNTMAIMDSLKSDSIILEFNESLLKYELSASTYLKGENKEKIDSAHNERFKELLSFGDDSTSTEKGFSKIISSLPPWLEILIWILFAAASIVIYLYLKWRQDKMKTIKKMQDEAFKKEMSKAKTSEQKRAKKESNKATKIYSEQEMQAEDFKRAAKMAREKQKTASLAQSKVSTPIPAKPTTKRGGITQKDKVELEEMINKVRQAQTEQPSKSQLLNHLKSKPELSADVEMALNMANEQKRMKQDQIKEISSQKLEDDGKNIDEKAKELGIDKASLETKKALDNLSEDSSYYAKLADKFGKKTDGGS